MNPILKFLHVCARSLSVKLPINSKHSCLLFWPDSPPTEFRCSLVLLCASSTGFGTFHLLLWKELSCYIILCQHLARGQTFLSPSTNPQGFLCGYLCFSFCVVTSPCTTLSISEVKKSAQILAMEFWPSETLAVILHWRTWLGLNCFWPVHIVECHYLHRQLRLDIDSIKWIMLVRVRMLGIVPLQIWPVSLGDEEVKTKTWRQARPYNHREEKII